MSDEAALRRKIASLMVVGFRGDTVGPDDWIVRAVRDQGLGGIILFDRDQLTGSRRNINSPAQVTELVRLSPSNGFGDTRSQAEIGAANSTEATRAWADDLVAELTTIGVNLNFAPVVDLAINPTSPAVAGLDRGFSADPRVVVSCAAVEIEAHRDAGIRTAIKHFPGLGSATGNTDFEVVDVSDTWQAVELEPYQRLIDDDLVDMVMVAHLLNKQLDPSRPASLSAQWSRISYDREWAGTALSSATTCKRQRSRAGSAATNPWRSPWKPASTC